MHGVGRVSLRLLVVSFYWRMHRILMLPMGDELFEGQGDGNSEVYGVWWHEGIYMGVIEGFDG